MSREAMQMALEALELLAKYENPSTKIQVRKPKDGGSYRDWETDRKSTRLNSSH